MRYASAAVAIVLGAIVAVAITLAFGLATRALAYGSPITVRACPEDAVHVGVGDFDNGRWEAYRCVARDNIVDGGFTFADVR